MYSVGVIVQMVCWFEAGKEQKYSEYASRRKMPPVQDVWPKKPQKTKKQINLAVLQVEADLANLPDITGRTALAVRPDAVNAKYHVITNATYNCDPAPAKFKHVMNIETCTLLCCDYSTLWEALHANKVEIGARCSDKNVKILGRYQWISS